MAQETKIALVVGLGFIVCFALVLTNRGQQAPVPPALTQRPARQTDAPGSGPGIASRRNEGVAAFHEPAATTLIPPAGAVPAPVAGAAGPTAPPPKQAAGQDTPPPVPAHAPATTVPTGGLDASMQPIRTADASSAATQHPLGPDVAPVRPGPVPTPTSIETLRAAMPTGAAPARVDGGTSPSKVYEVRPGDTLYGIAGRLYGSKSASVVRAIYEANRSAMPSPNAIRVGQRLTLPALPESAPATPPTSVREPPRTPTSAPPAAAQDDAGLYRWYKVQKDDRYVTIAREQLGDAGRWREIYELNKDKFPDPDKIRDGVRIRLPAAALADARERRP